MRFAGTLAFVTAVMVWLLPEIDHFLRNLDFSFGSINVKAIMVPQLWVVLSLSVVLIVHLFVRFRNMSDVFSRLQVLETNLSRLEEENEKIKKRCRETDEQVVQLEVENGQIKNRCRETEKMTQLLCSRMTPLFEIIESLVDLPALSERLESVEEDLLREVDYLKDEVAQLRNRENCQQGFYADEIEDRVEKLEIDFEEVEEETSNTLTMVYGVQAITGCLTERTKEMSVQLANLERMRITLKQTMNRVENVAKHCKDVESNVNNLQEQFIDLESTVENAGSVGPPYAFYYEPDSASDDSD